MHTLKVGSTALGSKCLNTFIPDLVSVNLTIKAGVHLKAVFLLGIMVLTQISRSRFKQSKISMLISHIYVSGCFVNFLGIFGEK